jgi:hypothetical protein
MPECIYQGIPPCRYGFVDDHYSAADLPTTTTPVEAEGGKQSKWDRKADPEDIVVAMATDKMVDHLSVSCGDYFYILRPEHIAALRRGEMLMLAVAGGQYNAFLIVRE